MANNLKNDQKLAKGPNIEKQPKVEKNGQKL